LLHLSFTIEAKVKTEDMKKRLFRSFAVWQLVQKFLPHSTKGDLCKAKSISIAVTVSYKIWHTCDNRAVNIAKTPQFNP